jgi:uncharacterized cupin superfamily protein
MCPSQAVPWDELKDCADAGEVEIKHEERASRRVSKGDDGMIAAGW